MRPRKRCYGEEVSQSSSNIAYVDRSRLKQFDQQEASEFLILLEDVCNNNDHTLGSPCDDDFWPRFAGELSKQRLVYISSKLCETFCHRLLTFHKVMKDPTFDKQAHFGELNIERHLGRLDKIFGNHAHKFLSIPETLPSSSSLKRSYDLSGTSFLVAPGSTLSPAEEIEIQQILGDMVRAGQLTLIDLCFAQDWLMNGVWAAGVFRREQDPDLRKEMIRNARAEVGDVWMEKRMKRM